MSIPDRRNAWLILDLDAELLARSSCLGVATILGKRGVGSSPGHHPSHPLCNPGARGTSQPRPHSPRSGKAYAKTRMASPTRSWAKVSKWRDSVAPRIRAPEEKQHVMDTSLQVDIPSFTGFPLPPRFLVSSLDVPDPSTCVKQRTRLPVLEQHLADLG